jgi:hypothetical protein
MAPAPTRQAIKSQRVGTPEQAEESQAARTQSPAPNPNTNDAPQPPVADAAKPTWLIHAERLVLDDQKTHEARARDLLGLPPVPGAAPAKAGVLVGTPTTEPIVRAVFLLRLPAVAGSNDDK